MTLVDVAADRHQMHDGKDAGAPVIVLFELPKIRKQPLDVGIAPERLRHRSSDRRVDRPILEQRAQRLAGTIALDGNRPDQRHRCQVPVRLAAVDLPFDPRDLRNVHAEFVLQQTLYENRCRHRVHRQTDALALEIFRRADEFAVDSDESVTKRARRKDWYGDEGTTPG